MLSSLELYHYQNAGKKHYRVNWRNHNFRNIIYKLMNDTHSTSYNIEIKGYFNPVLISVQAYYTRPVQKKKIPKKIRKYYT